MNKLGIFLGGFVSGSVITVSAGYFFVYKKYIPLRELEESIADLENEKRDLYHKIDEIQKSIEHLSDSKRELESRLESENLKSQRKNSERIKQRSETISYDHQYVGNEGTPYQPETTVPEELLEDDDDEGLVPTIISDDFPRIDGRLTKKEQQEIDDCGEDDQLAHTILTKIKEERFNASIDENCTSYMIDRETFDNKLDFFSDPLYLIYYRPEGIVALQEGNEIIEDPDQLFDTSCLNHFEDRNSKMIFENDDGEKTLICRNDNLLTDYVISCVDKTYVEAIKEQEGQ